MAERKPRPIRGPYDRNVRLNQIHPADEQNGNEDERRRSGRIKSPSMKFNVAHIKCPVCQKAFRMDLPIKFYDGFVACSVECWKHFL